MTQPLPSTSLRKDNFLWKINPAACIDAFLARLSHPIALMDPPAKPVRPLDTQIRATHVVRLSLPHLLTQGLIVKRYYSRTLWQRIRTMFRASRAFQAFETSLRLAHLGIPTAIPVAAGEHRRFRYLVDSYFISEELNHACSLWEFRQREPQPPLRLFKQLGQIIAQLHEAGLSHTDPSVSNFFVQQSAPDGPWNIVLIDLDAIRKPPLASPRGRLRELNRFLTRVPLSHRETLVFLAAYARQRRPRHSARTLLAQIQHQSSASQTARGSFAVRQVGRLLWRLRPDYDSAPINPILQNPDHFLQDSTLHFKNSRVVTVARLPASGDRPGLVLRRLNYGKILHQFRDLFRATRCQRALLHAAQLEQFNIRTPPALAVADHRKFLWPRRAYLLTLEIQNAKTLETILAESKSPPFVILARVADLLSQLHAAGFSYRDFKSSNILIDPAAQPWLIDLDGLRSFPPLTLNRARSDVGRLIYDFNQTPFAADCIRFFLQRYCRRRHLQTLFPILPRTGPPQTGHV